MNVLLQYVCDSHYEEEEDTFWTAQSQLCIFSRMHSSIVAKFELNRAIFDHLKTWT